jgi:CHAT domain-containing protein
MRRILDEEPNGPINPVVHLSNERATVDAARDMIASQQFDMVHFACHASQDDHDPLKSGFSLEGGKLTLADIIRRRHEVESTPKSSMALAFLSACQTSTETENFSEEAVHLVAGMLAAGYRGVVGTMWGIPDKYAPVIAEEFYRRLLGRNEPRADAALALHCATETLRRRLGDSEYSYLAWIPFVHFGL